MRALRFAVALSTVAVGRIGVGRSDHDYFVDLQDAVTVAQVDDARVAAGREDYRRRPGRSL